MTIKISKIKKKFLLFGKKKILTLAILFSILGQPNMAKANLVISNWVKSNQQYTQIIEQEKKGDGYIYLILYLEQNVKILKYIKEHPENCELSYNKNEFICNSLKDFIQKGKEGQIAIEVNLRTNEITNFYNLNGNKILEMDFTKKNEKEKLEIIKKKIKKEGFELFKSKVYLGNNQIVYSGEINNQYFLVYRKPNLNYNSYRIIIGDKNKQEIIIPSQVRMSRNSDLTLETKLGTFYFGTYDGISKLNNLNLIRYKQN